MTDLTAGRAKCLLPVGNLPLLWFPLKMLQNSGFQSAIVTVPDTAKAEVNSTLSFWLKGYFLFHASS
jgi:translation initiation factor eIF-2B subunit gamma